MNDPTVSRVPIASLFFFQGALGDFLKFAPVLEGARASGRRLVIGAPFEIASLCFSGTDASILSKDDPRFRALFQEDPDPDSVAFLRSFDEVVVVAPDSAGFVSDRLVRLLGTGIAIVHPPLPERGSVASHHASLATRLGVTCDVSGIRERIRRRIPVERPGKGALTIHPGSGSALKNWPLESFLEIARANPATFLLGPVEENWTLPGVKAVRDLSLEEVAKLLLASDRYLGNDGGVGHLAGLLDLPRVIVAPKRPVEFWGDADSPRERVLFTDDLRLAPTVPEVLSALESLG